MGRQTTFEIYEEFTLYILIGPLYRALACENDHSSVQGTVSAHQGRRAHAIETGIALPMSMMLPWFVFVFGNPEDW
jgi:hypothetical protein